MAKGTYTSFQGLWDRGDIDKCPPDHLIECFNCKFVDESIATREGSSLAGTASANILKTRIYKPNPPYSAVNKPRFLYLTDTGELFDYTVSPLSLIVANVNIKDFSVVNLFGRAYISFHGEREALAGSLLWVYDGTGPAGMRLAAGAVATNTPVVGVAGAGTLEVGTYLVATANETASGFITQPSPFVNFNSIGSEGRNLTIPIGPAGTAARWVIVTKAIPTGTYNGNPQEYPWFFASRIGDNVTTAYYMNFYDENLRDSADYLLDRLVQVPAGVGLAEYNGRLVIWGEITDPSLIRVSEVGEPESFSSTSGFKTVYPNVGGGLKTGVEFRGTFYLQKLHHTFAIQDNGGDVSTWEITSIDHSIGTEINGILELLDEVGSTSDGFIAADYSGLVYFNGIYTEPKLSYKIEKIWDRVNKSYYHKIRGINDAINKRLYIAVPLDNAITNSHMLVGDYKNGMHPLKIKWSIWTFPYAINDAAVWVDFSAAGVPTVRTWLFLGSAVHELSTTSPYSDNGAKIDSYFTLPPYRAGDGLSHFNQINVRAKGSGFLDISALSMDSLTTVNPASITLGVTPGREYDQLMNLVSEHCKVKFANRAVTNYFEISKVQVFAEQLWTERPR